MNTYRFIFQFATVEIKASTLGLAYQILERERFMHEQKLMTVECVRVSYALPRAEALEAVVAQALELPQAE